MRDINCGDDSTFKTNMNFKPFIDTPQQDFEQHSTTINNQSVAPPNIQGFNMQLKGNNLELEKCDNCKATDLIPGKQKSRVTKIDALRDKISEEHDSHTMARVSNPSLDTLRVFPTWT